MNDKLTIPNSIILMALGSTLLYVVFNNLPIIIGSHRFFWAPLTLLVILYSRPSSLSTRPMQYLWLYGFLSLGLLQYTLWDYMNAWIKKSFLEEFYILIFCMAILCYYWIKGDFKQLALLGKWSFIFILITLVMTNLALSFDIYVVRQSAFPSGFTPFQEKIYRLTGCAGYGYAQGFVLLIPVLVYHIKKRIKMIFPSKVLVLILMVILITMIRAQVFANFIMSFIILLLSFLGSKKKVAVYRSIAFIVILIVFVPSSFFPDEIDNISSLIEPNIEMHKKLTDFADFMRNPEFDDSTMAGGRVGRYPELFEALKANPLLGDASYASRFRIGAGAHLYWMYRLAIWGIFGFLFFVFVLYKIFNKISSLLFDNEIKYYYSLSLLALIGLGLMKVIAGREPWVILIIVIPGLFLMNSQKSTKSINPKNS